MNNGLSIKGRRQGNDNDLGILTSTQLQGIGSNINHASNNNNDLISTSAFSKNVMSSNWNPSSSSAASNSVASALTSSLSAPKSQGIVNSINNNSNNSSYNNNNSRDKGKEKEKEKEKEKDKKTEHSPNKISNLDKYWKQPVQPGAENIVVIHVCDENRHVTRDFCCKRNILVKHMEYFDKFLAENESGYDDIDISVHCDVEIFEWLMTYIHEPDSPPQLEKSIVVSILISSEFLQMDPLVDVCLENISSHLSDIIKLPIDLSCISEKLINKLAHITHPKILSQTRDRKDKILNKLYKRRVELDFSRKSNSRGGARTIAASLTCCRHCGIVYLDHYVSMLSCRNSFPSIEFRGKLARRHSAIPSWSLTAYLKTLHAGGMSWESIYWHVWAACVVFRSSDVMFSALEVDKYTLEQDGILLNPRGTKESAEESPNSRTKSALNNMSNQQQEVMTTFSLSFEEDLNAKGSKQKILVTKFDDENLMHPNITPSLNPSRQPEILTPDIYELLCSQMKCITALQYKQLIENTFKSIISTSGPVEDPLRYDYADILWVDIDAAAGVDGEEARGRSRSPGRSGKEPRKLAHSLPATVNKARGGLPLPSDDNTGGVADSDNEGGNANGDNGEGATPSMIAATNAERRLRSSSMGNRQSRFRKSSVSRRRGRSRGVSGSGGGHGNGDYSGKEIDWADELTPLEVKHHCILKGLPPEISRRVGNGKGHVHGIWLIDHPLQSHPLAEMEMIGSIQESTLSDAKKLEWELDVLREYDEKRMDKFESFLVSKRINNAEIQLRPNGNGAANTLSMRYQKMMNVNRVERGSFSISSNNHYYKDKGRQSYK